MKLSVSIPDRDLEFIDRYADDHAIPSRSGVVHRAVSLLRAAELGQDYAAAWDDWTADDAAAWDSTTADGMA